MAMSFSKRSLGNQSGQIVVEYILLLGIGVVVAILLSSTLVSRNPASPGLIVKKWHDIIEMIGADNADDLTDTE